MKVLFINCCVRKSSRTRLLAGKYLSKFNADEIEEVNLMEENIQPLNQDLLDKRDYLIRNNINDDLMFKYAKQFKEADEIVIAAPYWDLSFPALLKIYFENISVTGITFKYDEGRPVGLCKGNKLTFITTSGGPIFNDYGYSYVKALASSFYGIKEIECIRAMNLDVEQISLDEFMDKAKIEYIK